MLQEAFLSSHKYILKHEETRLCNLPCTVWLNKMEIWSVKCERWNTTAAMWIGLQSLLLPLSPHQSRFHLIELCWLQLLLTISFYDFRNNIFLSNEPPSKKKRKKKRLQLLSSLPWYCGELLFQCLNVCELDSLSSSSGFNHLTLNERKNK